MPRAMLPRGAVFHAPAMALMRQPLPLSAQKAAADAAAAAAYAFR